MLLNNGLVYLFICDKVKSCGHIALLPLPAGAAPCRTLKTQLRCVLVEQTSVLSGSAVVLAWLLGNRAG